MAATTRIAFLLVLILAYGECQYRDNGYTNERTPSNEILCKFSDVVNELICRQTNAEKWYFIDSMPALSAMTKVIIENVYTNTSDIFDIERDLFTHTSSLESLTISNCKLPNVHQLNLRKCPQLKIFNASQNSIANLRGFTFWGTKLQVLDLSFNKIAFIDNDAFNVKSFGIGTGSSPTELHLFDENEDGPNAGEYATHVQRGLDLTELYLHNNRLTAVKSEWFENLPKLTVLTLNNNLIREFDGISVLSNKYLLAYFRIDNNLLTSIKNMNVANLPDLKTVDVSSNTELGERGAKVIINLSLVKMNNISIIECHVNPSASEIYANHNNISALLIHSTKPDDITLTKLYLAHNKMKDLKNITLLPHLQSLDLSHNLIETIEVRTFHGLTELMHLNLEHNLIQQVAGNSFNGLASLAVLNFSSNKLTEFPVEFGETNLEDLDISGNALTSMNTNIKRKTIQLKRINIADNAWECSQLSDTLLFLLMDDIDVFSPDIVSKSYESNVRGIGCNKTTAIVDETESIGSAEADKLRQEIETMLDEKINNFERKITDLIIKIHLNANQPKN